MPNENFNLPFLSGMLLGGMMKRQAEDIAKRNAPSVTEQIDNIQKNIFCVARNMERLSFAEFNEFLQSMVNLGEVCDKICKQRGWDPDED